MTITTKLINAKTNNNMLYSSNNNNHKTYKKEVLRYADIFTIFEL